MGDFAPGAMTPARVEGRDLLIARDGDAWYAFPDRCTHAKRPLSDGDYGGGVVTCVHHGATFDLRQGGKPTMPALRPLTCHPVAVDGDEVFVTLG